MENKNKDKVKKTETTQKKVRKTTSQKTTSKQNKTTVAAKKAKNKSLFEKVKSFLSSITFLRIVFIVLCITVAILAVCVMKVEKERKLHPKARIVIPMTADGDDFSFNIDALALSGTDEYIFKVTNKRDKKINKEEVTYKVEIENETDCIISVTKDNSKKDLMKDQKSTIIEEKLEKDVYDEDYYHVKITSSGKLNIKDLIQIKIHK